MAWRPGVKQYTITNLPESNRGSAILAISPPNVKHTGSLCVNQKQLVPWLDVSITTSFRAAPPKNLQNHRKKTSEKPWLVKRKAQHKQGRTALVATTSRRWCSTHRVDSILGQSGGTVSRLTVAAENHRKEPLVAKNEPLQLKNHGHY